MDKLHAHYARHRRAIDQVIGMANKRITADETQARERIHSASWQLEAILVPAMAAGIGVALQILRKLFHRLGVDLAHAAALAGRIAGGDLTVGIALRPGDARLPRQGKSRP